MTLEKKLLELDKIFANSELIHLAENYLEVGEDDSVEDMIIELKAELIALLEK